jgi:hypothetical protein
MLSSAPVGHRGIIAFSRVGACFALAALAVAAAATPAAASTIVDRRLCVFDPLGTHGAFFDLMRGHQTAALEWGVRFELVPYTDETTALSDLQAGRCHGALLTGTRARPFNRFTATIEAIGALERYEDLRAVIDLLARPRAAERLATGGFAIAALYPAGSVHMYFRDRGLARVEALAGRRIATLEYDRPSIAMVDRVGAAMVPAAVATIAPLFNNGNVDACYAPALAYQALELHRGLGENGAILRHPLVHLTLQLVLREDAGWPEDFAAQSRRHAAAAFDRARAPHARAEAAIPEASWVASTGEEAARFRAMFRDARLALRDEGVYDPAMLRLMRRVRCNADGDRAECAEAIE